MGDGAKQKQHTLFLEHDIHLLRENNYGDGELFWPKTKVHCTNAHTANDLMTVTAEAVFVSQSGAGGRGDSANTLQGKERPKNLNRMKLNLDEIFFREWSRSQRMLPTEDRWSKLDAHVASSSSEAPLVSQAPARVLAPLENDNDTRVAGNARVQLRKTCYT